MKWHNSMNENKVECLYSCSCQGLSIWHHETYHYAIIRRSLSGCMYWNLIGISSWVSCCQQVPSLCSFRMITIFPFYILSISQAKVDPHSISFRSDKSFQLVKNDALLINKQTNKSKQNLACQNWIASPLLDQDIRSSLLHLHCYSADRMM